MTKKRKRLRSYTPFTQEQITEICRLALEGMTWELIGARVKRGPDPCKKVFQDNRKSGDRETRNKVRRELLKQERIADELLARVAAKPQE